MLPEIKSVAVIGAGTMGQGIAQVSAAAGYTTKLYDLDETLSFKALESIKANLSQLVSKNKISADSKVATLSRLSVEKNSISLKADVVIEAVVEKLAAKQNLFLELEKINEGKAILATNTSSIPITQIAAVLQNPSLCLGLHFFNPAPVMKLVEVIMGEATSQEVAGKMRTFSLSLGKNPVMVKDSPGFIVNRVARHYYVEALKLLEEGVATHAQIDALLRSAGFKMGPFELMDLIGVDVNLAVTTSLYDSFNQAHRFKPNPIQQRKVKDGDLGKKTGKGFYEYAK
ncbi:MAG: 3-hydroxybutyryl-CoA dehydrogenase [Chryseotalea sp. WA131a]|nr:MAG: 3-hydroxybutyryl-CoA dehydrogenase [Chryseotalea sp. WA131a]